jgi:uncharacterized protein (TIGR02118 family)
VGLGEADELIKAMIFLKRRKDLTRAEFKEYWLTQHSKLEKENAEKNWVRKIVANFAIDDPSLPEPPWDGMVELYFDSIEDMQKDVQGAQRAVMYADEENFCDHSEEQLVVLTQEYLMAVKTPLETSI